MKRARLVLPLVLLLVAAGCGMYGPLYLEEEAPPPATPAPEAQEDEEEAAGTQ